MPSKTKRMNAQERRSQILDAAREVFIENGYKGTTTIEIARRADVSEVTLFRYFSSKQEMFIQAIEPLLTGDIQQIIDGSNGLPPRDKLKKLLVERVNFITNNRDLIKLVLLESQINNDILSINIVERMVSYIKNALENFDLTPEKKNLSLRMFIGVLLSYLFIPEKQEDDVIKNINQIVEAIFTKQYRSD